MKKILLICMLLLALLLCSCGTPMLTEEEVSKDNSPDISMFIRVENGEGYKIVYHRDSKVMYAISDGYYNMGTFTVMLNADGTPMLWEDSRD